MTALVSPVGSAYKTFYRQKADSLPRNNPTNPPGCEAGNIA